MRFTREEYIDLLTFKDNKRQMFVELFGPLIGLEDEWAAQGATIDEINLTAFDFDYIDRVSCGGSTSIISDITPHVIQENNNEIISIDSYGRKMKLIKGFATIALPMEYPVTDMDSWLKIKPWFVFNDNRIDWEQVDKAKILQNKGSIVCANIPGGFDLPRQLLGEENVCMCYYDYPELMNDILNTISDTAFKVLNQISDHLLIDNLGVHEDMAGKTGSLVGPNLISQYIKPYYRRIWDMVSLKGTKIFSQDSDGNMNSVIDAFMGSGVNLTYPAEPASGMDIVSLRKRYGKSLMFKGGIDKHVLRKDKAAIRNELEYKLQPLMQEGGNIFGLDHRIPNGTPIENYRYYVQTSREILGLEPIGKSKGWARMAF